ncbi:transporter substrate-binding domain-containing protein [Mesorhizobium sp. M0482]|uniref:hypothetical protein n=1 Tax=Mesorhizobium sp. M0482 TaxID=2956948 RepID=UPI0033381FEB
MSVPETLWNYGRLQVQDMPQIPMMGVYFAQQFVIAFVLGWLFIAYFAWERFNTRQSGPKDFRYRVMKEVEVSDLGGAAALRQAYLIYLSSLLFLYVAMTFFGKLIVQTLNALNVVGIQVDASSLQFDSPQWPLMLAFGFAGLAPLIPQLRMAEGWLFQRAYRAVGIPVRIHETTRNLVSLLDAATAGELVEAQSLVDELSRKLETIRSKTDGIWVREILNPAKLESSLTLLAQLELLVAWAKGRRGTWPGSEVSDALRDMEQNIANQADDLLDGFERRVRERASSGEGKAAREKYIAEIVVRAHELRDELTAILAVYVERDPSCVWPSANAEGLIRDPGLRELLRKADPPNLAGTGPEFGVLICILFTIPIYSILTWQGLHPPLSAHAMPGSLIVILATAGLETLRLVSIFWFPLLVAFAVRQYYYDERKWIARARPDDRSAYAEQRLAVVGMAFVVSVICLSGIAALWAFFIAKDVSGFQALLVGGENPFLLFYPSMALITLPLVWLTLLAADARVYRHPALAYGMWSALLVVACHASHLAFWYSAQACTRNAIFLTDLFADGCFSYYGGLDFFVIPVLAFLVAVVFGNPRSASFALRSLRLTQRGAAPTALILAVALALISVRTPAALAQEGSVKPVVTIGFRADVEPFSYKVSADGGTHDGNRPLYRGFLADLCYWIFDGGDYSVVEKEVTALDRFEKLRNGKIDVLCDPVTMRFSETERAASGTFSPIVFATGITYLQRRNRGAGTSAYIGYVESTTAANVVEHLCKIDLFGIVPPDERSELATMCETASVARRTVKLPPLGTQQEWYKDFLKKVEQVASEEETSVKLQLGEASAQTKEPLEKSLRTWTETVDQIKTCRETGKLDCTPDWILERLGGSCNDLENSQLGRVVYRFCSFESHTELIDWFCKPRTGKAVPGMVYLGDREIILGKLQTWNEQHSARCVVENENGAGDMTYEPYAIMVAKPSPKDSLVEMLRRQDIAELVQRRVYEFFSFSSLARTKFDTYFLGPRKDRSMSTALAYLFLLNSVEEERLFTFPTEEATASKPTWPPIPAVERSGRFQP